MKSKGNKKNKLAVSFAGGRKGGKRKRVLWRNQKTDPKKEERAREKGQQFCQLRERLPVLHRCEEEKEVNSSNTAEIVLAK